jgi:hypothetical protein
MNNDLLTESSWKATAAKNKVKDNGLHRALADLERIDEDDHPAQLKAIAKVDQLANALKRSKEVSDNDAVVDYLNDLQKAAEAEEREINKAKASADKMAAIADKQEKQEEMYEAKLWAMLQKLKSARGSSFEFLLCEGPDKSALIVAPAIAAPHRQQLIQLTGGKRFIGPGTCRFDDGKYVFATDRAPSGLAKKLQLSIFNATKRRLPITVGTEAEDGEV